MNKQEQEREFLSDVARMQRKGLLMKEIAEALQMSPGNLTYRLHRLGYQTQTRIVDARTGEPLTETMAA